MRLFVFFLSFSTVFSRSITSYFCHIPLLQALCPRSSNTVLMHNVIGVPTVKGVTRYVAKYATASRWSPPVMSKLWIPANASDPTALPPLCPQSGVDLSEFSEDCLDLVLYVPPNAKKSPGGVPALVWVHGGSSIVGGATDPALEGSNLALATNSIVAVVQYRLGVLGLLPPSSNSANGNLALQDLMTALTFLHCVLPYFGGTPGTPQLTMAGQSTGASYIRALLGTSAAWGLFTNAWLHSDAMNYGFLTAKALETLRSAWVDELGCSSSCAEAMDLETLLEHQDNLFNNAPALDPEFYFAWPIRPSDHTIDYTFTHPSAFPPSSDLKPVVITNVKDEAIPSVYSFFPDSQGPISMDTFNAFLVENLGPNRTERVLEAPFYPVNVSVDLRMALATISTDGVWRCPDYALARHWAAHGGKKHYSGLFTVGITYPSNEDVPECLQPGSVCHQDDIEVVFGTGPGPISLTREIQARYAAFIRTGSPNAAGYPTWQTTTSFDTNTLNLGGSPSIPVGACVPTFWGGDVLFDYQTNHE